MTRCEDRVCDEVRERLPLLHYGALDPHERAEVETHLRACASCAKRLEATRRILAAVTAADAFPRENEIDWTAFARATVARAREAERPGSRGGRSLLLWGGILAAAAALVVFVGLRGLHAPPSAPPAIASGPAVPGADEAEDARTLQRGLARRAAERSLREGRAVLLDLMQTPVRCRRQDGRVDVALEKERARDL